MLLYLEYVLKCFSDCNFISMIDYYAAQLARQQQQEREHAAQIETAQRQQAAQRAQQQQFQEQQQQQLQAQQQQIIQAQQPAQPVGIRVCFLVLVCYFI
jgi:isoaspartyl peptidase/L-asparaginase-like protein (Ntn-hydrolase superfamily)